MRKMIVAVTFGAAGALLTLAVMSVTQNAGSVSAQSPARSYAEDRAAIEDLQARYLFALDYHDPDTYV